MKLSENQMKFLDDAFELWTARHADTPDYFRVRKHFTFAKIQLSGDLPLEPSSEDAVKTLLMEALRYIDSEKSDLTIISEIASALALETVREYIDIHIV